MIDLNPRATVTVSLDFVPRGAIFAQGSAPASEPGSDGTCHCHFGEIPDQVRDRLGESIILHSDLTHQILTILTDPDTRVLGG